MHLPPRLLLATLIALSACQAASSSSEPSKELAEACAAYAAADCGAYDRCSPFFLRIAHEDVAACVARRRLLCLNEARLPGVAATPAALQACAEALRAQACPENLAAGNYVPQACALPGTLAEGKACSSSAQCSSGVCARSGKACGVCAARRPAGSPCAQPTDCERGLSCLPDTVEGESRCVALGQAGAACRVIGGLSDCLPTLICKAGRCAPALPGGAACDPSADEDPCDFWQGLHCSNAGSCELFRVGSVGELCGDVGLCRGGARCYGPGPRRCVAAAPDGGACGSDRLGSGPGCDLGATCDGAAGPMSCQLPGAALCQ